MLYIPPFALLQQCFSNIKLPHYLHPSLNMDPSFVHRQFPTSYIRTKLDSDFQFLVEHAIENTALPAAVEGQVTNQRTERQQQHPALQPVDDCEGVQHRLKPILLPPAALPFTPSPSSAEQEVSPEPADGSQQPIYTLAAASSLSPSEIDRIGEEFIAQLLQTPVSQEEADFLLSLPTYTPSRSRSGGQELGLFPPTPVEEEEPAAKEGESTNSPLVRILYCILIFPCCCLYLCMAAQLVFFCCLCRKTLAGLLPQAMSAVRYHPRLSLLNLSSSIQQLIAGLCHLLSLSLAHSGIRSVTLF